MERIFRVRKPLTPHVLTRPSTRRRLTAASGRARPRGVPEEVGEETHDGDNEDHDDPEDLPAFADVVAPDHTHRDEEPDEDPNCERRGRQAETELIREEHAISLV